MSGLILRSNPPDIAQAGVASEVGGACFHSSLSRLTKYQWDRRDGPGVRLLLLQLNTPFQPWALFLLPRTTQRKSEAVRLSSTVGRCRGDVSNVHYYCTSIDILHDQALGVAQQAQASYLQRYP